MAVKENDIIKAGFWYLISLLTTRVIGFLTTPIFTRVLSTEDYGIVATYNMWYNTLFVICSLNLAAGIGRAKKDFKNNFNSFIYSMQYLSLLATIGVFLIFLLLKKYIVPIMGMDIYTIILLFVALLFSPIVNFNQIKYKYEYNYKGNIVITIFTAVSTVFFSLLFVLVLDTGKYLGRILGIILPSLILSCFFWIKSIINKENKILIYAWRYAAKISVPMILHTLSQRVLAQSDQAMITYFCGASNTGVYSLANQFSLILALFVDSIAQVWAPWFFENLDERETYVSNLMKKIVVLGCYIVLLTVIVTPEAISILGTEEYRDGIYIVPLVVLGLLCQYISTHYINVELYYKKSGYISGCTIIVTICNLCLNRVFIPMFGYMAAAWTTLISYFLMVILHACIVKFVIQRDVYNNKTIVKYLLITGLLTIIEVMLYDFPIVRYLLGIVLVVRMLYDNKEILFVLSRMMRKNRA